MLKVDRKIRSRQEFVNNCAEWCQKFNEKNKVIIFYVRKGRLPKIGVNSFGKRKPQGVLAAYRGSDGVLRVGWSLCNKIEPFDSKVGLRYALERAKPLLDHDRDFSWFLKELSKSTPHDIRKQLPRFLARVRKAL